MSVHQLGDNLLSICELDKDTTKIQVDSVKKRWKKLNDGVITKIQSLEDLQILMEYEEKVCDFQHTLQQLEDRLCSHDALGDVSHDPILLERVQNFRESRVLPLNKQINEANKLGQGLVQSATAGVDTNDLEQQLENLNNLWNKLQESLQEIREEIDQTIPEVDHCRQAGQNLMQLCGEPEVQRHIEDLDSVCYVTTLYVKREQNLVDAMEKAMQFHDTLQNLLEFLDTVEDKFGKLGAVSTDIDSVKLQIDQLKDFKLEVDPRMIWVESLNRQAQYLMKRTSPDQAVAIREPLADINRRWEDLLKNIVERQQEMEKTLLKLGQFQYAVDEFIVWIPITALEVNGIELVSGDPEVIEMVLAKQKVISNDILAHQTSLDTINRAGHEFMDSDRGREDAKFTCNILQYLNVSWQNLQNKASKRYQELEDALKEAQQLHQDIKDLLMWLSDMDAQMVTSKPVGGLFETANEQLNQFLDVYDELDSNWYLIENVLTQGDVYLKRSTESSTKSTQHSLNTLKQRWESIMYKANDRKIKLEIAFREANEFHKALQQCVDWLTNAEKYLTTMRLVSRFKTSLLEQVDDHKSFQRDINAQRENMVNLEKKGNHLKYFSQKQDVIRIKNVLTSVQNRWERVERTRENKAVERTRSLDDDLKEANQGGPDAEISDAEKIQDEVQRQVSKCTCKFKVYKVGEGKYQFGDYEKLVRILRSTVMVRVGGGWEALDEFLLKNDPCRDVSYKSSSMPSSRQGSQPSSRAPSDLSQDAVNKFKKLNISSAQRVQSSSKSAKTADVSKIPSAKKPVKLPSNKKSPWK